MVSLSKHWKHSSGARCLVLLYVLVMGVFSMQPSHGNWLLSSCTRSQKGSDKDKGCHGGSEPGSIPSSCCYLCYVLAAGEFQVCTEAAFWGYWFCSCWIAFPAWFFGPILLGGLPWTLVYDWERWYRYQYSVPTSMSGPVHPYFIYSLCKPEM